MPARENLGNVIIGQSGGPTSVINQSLVGTVKELCKQGCARRVLGARHGVRGIVEENFVALDSVADELLERIAATPSAALGSTRDKPDEEYCERILKSLRKHDIRTFFYIGGNDSADTARIVDQLAADAGYELRTFHIPKTIDNDLRVHDHAPGYGSAARFVIAASMGSNLDNVSLPGIKIDVIMGRHAGFLTAAAALARRFPGDGPHLLYVPEAPVSEDALIADVERVYARLGRCLIAVSEGIALPGGTTWAEKLASGLERDSHGNVQLSGSGALGDHLASLIKRRLSPSSGKALRVRADTFGSLQRSFPEFVSEVDASESRLVGTMAARYACEQHAEGSIAMRRVGGPDYRVETFLTPLDSVARHTRHLEPTFIESGNDIRPEFFAYARPLVGALPILGTLDER